VGPNPTTGKLDVQYTGYSNTTAKDIELYDLKGTLVSDFGWNGSDIRLDLSSYPKGIYVMVIQSTGAKEVKKIVLQ
jgi:hypothetical protein